MKKEKKVRVLKGKTAGIILSVCAAVIIVSLIISSRVDHRSTAFLIMDILQALAALTGLFFWALYMILKLRAEKKR